MTCLCNGLYLKNSLWVLFHIWSSENAFSLSLAFLSAWHVNSDPKLIYQRNSEVPVESHSSGPRPLSHLSLRQATGRDQRQGLRARPALLHMHNCRYNSLHVVTRRGPELSLLCVSPLTVEMRIREDGPSLWGTAGPVTANKPPWQHRGKARQIGWEVSFSLVLHFTELPVFSSGSNSFWQLQSYHTEVFAQTTSHIFVVYFLLCHIWGTAPSRHQPGANKQTAAVQTHAHGCGVAKNAPNLPVCSALVKTTERQRDVC